MDAPTYWIIAHIVVSVCVAIGVTAGFMVHEARREARGAYPDGPPPIVPGAVMGLFWPVALVAAVVCSPFLAIHFTAGLIASHWTEREDA